MRKIKIEIETQNSAFENNECTEIARILLKLAKYIDAEHAQDLARASPITLFDVDGNRVGHVKIFS